MFLPSTFQTRPVSSLFTNYPLLATFAPFVSSKFVAILLAALLGVLIEIKNRKYLAPTSYTSSCCSVGNRGTRHQHLSIFVPVAPKFLPIHNLRATDPSGTNLCYFCLQVSIFVLQLSQIVATEALFASNP